jgi:hypothetical protein
MINHKEVKGQPVLAVRNNKPFVERKIIGRRRLIPSHVFRKDTLKMAVNGLPDFLFGI